MESVAFQTAKRDSTPSNMPSPSLSGSLGSAVGPDRILLGSDEASEGGIV